MDISIKNCPFCKNQIPIHSEKCPVCKMVLIERIITNFTKTVISQQNPIPKEKEPEINETPKHTQDPEEKARTKPIEDTEPDYFDYIISPKFDKYYNIIKKRKVLILSTLVLIILMIIFINHKTENNSEKTIDESRNNTNLTLVESSPKVSNENLSQNNTNNNLPSYPKLDIPEKYYSNGHVFERNGYSLHGQGLLTIKNGTSYDAVAKLVNIATRKSVLTIYIRRNSDLNIGKINDGNYHLYFVLGKNYDEKQNVFLEDCSFSVFQETFDYTTYTYEVEGGEKTNYSVFEVTLHPVIGGTARTSSVSKEEFMSL